MVFVRALHEYQENLSGKENYESLQEAYLALEQAVLNDSANLTLRFLSGLILNSLGEFRQARPQFEWIIKESDQQNVRLAAYYNLAMAEYSCFTERENKQSEKNFTTILKILGTDQKKLQKDQIILMALAHCGLASVLGQRFHLKKLEFESRFDRTGIPKTNRWTL